MREILFVDFHVHIYPNFDLNRAIQTSLMNFNRSKCTKIEGQQTFKVWALTERSDCNFFASLPGLKLRDYVFEPTDEKAAYVMKNRDTFEPELYILAGRQIITKENLEVCALGTTLDIVDRELSTADVIRAVNVHKGIAAVNWAPGKWFGARGEVVQEMLETHTVEQLYVSDTTMRPTFWRTPALMKEAMGRGFKVLCGSDPLPFEEEEDMVGKYFTALEGEFNPDQPAESIQNMLLASRTQPQCCGRRSGPLTFSKRQRKIMRHKQEN